MTGNVDINNTPEFRGWIKSKIEYIEGSIKNLKGLSERIKGLEVEVSHHKKFLWAGALAILGMAFAIIKKSLT